jgi:hypothetical protein
MVNRIVNPPGKIASGTRLRSMADEKGVIAGFYGSPSLEGAIC